MVDGCGLFCGVLMLCVFVFGFVILGWFDVALSWLICFWVVLVVGLLYLAFY